MKKEAMIKKEINNRRSKAVSPVVSTIILIMIVIIIAIIIILFARSFIKELVLKEVGGNSKRVEDFCPEVAINPILNGDGTFGIENEGNVPIFAISLITSKAGNSKTEKVDISVNPGYSKMIPSNIYGYRTDYEAVKLVPILLGKRKSDLVEPYTCAEQYGIDI